MDNGVSLDGHGFTRFHCVLMFLPGLIALMLWGYANPRYANGPTALMSGRPRKGTHRSFSVKDGLQTKLHVFRCEGQGW